MSFFTIEPETSGAPALATSPGDAECVFDTWLGDDVVRAYPAVLVTTPVKKALLDLPKPSGFEVTRARVRSSEFYRKHFPGQRLPAFWALQVKGQPGRDDIGLTAGGVLVVSRRVLDVLLDFGISRAELGQYVPGKWAGRPDTAKPIKALVPPEPRARK